MPGLLWTNYLGNTIRGMGRIAGPIYKAARSGLDTATSSRLAMYSTMGAGLGLYAWDRSDAGGSYGRGSSALGYLGLGIAGAAGFRGAYKGLMGPMAQRGVTRATQTGTSLFSEASIASRRMRDRAAIGIAQAGYGL